MIADGHDATINEGLDLVVIVGWHQDIVALSDHRDTQAAEDIGYAAEVVVAGVL